MQLLVSVDMHAVPPSFSHASAAVVFGAHSLLAAIPLPDGKRRGRRLAGPPSAPKAIPLLHFISVGGGL